MKKLIQKTLGLAGYALFNTRKQYGRDGLFTVHSDHFRYDPAFKAAYAQGIRAGGSFDPEWEWRVHVALWVASNALRIPGPVPFAGLSPGFVGLYQVNIQIPDLPAGTYPVKITAGSAVSNAPTISVTR